MAIIGLDDVTGIGGGASLNSIDNQLLMTGEANALVYVAGSNQECFRFGCYAESGTVEIALYDITSGVAGASLILSSGDMVINSPGYAWNTVDVGAVPLVQGNTYAVAFRASVTAALHKYNPPSNAIVRSTAIGTDAFLQSWASNGTQGGVWGVYAETRSAATGPVITGPGTAQEGVATSITGTDLATVTETALQDSTGTYSVVQSTVLNAGNLDVTPRRSVVAVTAGSPQPGIPVTPDLTSPSVTTPWASRWRVTDGVTPDTFAVTFSEKTGFQTLQVKIANADTTDGLFASDLITVEDDMQVTVETTTVDSVPVTLATDGNYSLGKTELLAAGGSTTLNPIYFSPGTGNISTLELTVTINTAKNAGEWIYTVSGAGQTNEVWITYLKSQGATGSTFNELMYNWLGGQGYTGSLSDRFAAWSKDNLVQ